MDSVLSNQFFFLYQNYLCALREALIATDWNDVLSDQNVESAFDNFFNKFMLLYDENVPLVVYTCKKKNYNKVPRMPWITKSILRSITKKNKLYYQYKRRSSDFMWRKYSKYRNTLTSVLRTAKKKYYSAQFQMTFNNIKNTWKVIRSFFQITI